MHIVICTDSSYLRQIRVMLTSLFLNNRGRNVNIHILFSGEQHHNLEPLKKWIIACKQQVTVHLFNSKSIRHLKVTDHISTATYIRFFIPDILSESIEKVLYLDIDLIVDSDINELWETDIKSDYAAAVFPEGNKDFNAGVLLVNLRKWRENKISSRLVEWATENNHNLRFWDQDVLNHILRGNVKPLDNRWNQLKTTGGKGIIHYAGSHKPWDPFYNNSNKKYYFKYLKKTPMWFDLYKLRLIKLMAIFSNFKNRIFN